MTTRLDACLECGASYTFGCVDAQEFCGPVCRKRWNNRRAMRGAQLLDLYMAHRFDRIEAQELGVFQAINRLASTFREEDRLARDGRRSWRPPARVLEERPHLRAARFVVRAGR